MEETRFGYYVEVEEMRDASLRLVMVVEEIEGFWLVGQVLDSKLVFN